MPKSVACAVVRDDPPTVFVADDLETLNWVLALKLIARIPGSTLEAGLRDELQAALIEERWGDAVSLWMHFGPEVDVYPSFEFHIQRDVELAPEELQFSPLFKG